MKQLQRGRSATTTFAAAAIALAIGLACWSPAALAAIDPIPGVDIIVKKNPGGIAFTVRTNAKGDYQLKQLPPGDYEICFAGQPCKTVLVGTDGGYKGSIKLPAKAADNAKSPLRPPPVEGTEECPDCLLVAGPGNRGVWVKKSELNRRQLCCDAKACLPCPRDK